MSTMPATPDGMRPGSPWHRLRRKLVRGCHVPAPCVATQLRLVRSRIRALAQVLALLTLAWVPMDIAWLGASHWVRALPLRLAMSALLFVLGSLVARMRMRTALSAFVWSQAIGFGILQWLVSPAQDSALEIGYGLFPFILVAQLATLPLPWWRTAGAAVAPALQLLVTDPLLSGTRGADLWNDLWLFVLLAAIATWASHAQLRMLVDLLGAQRDAAHDALTGLANRRASLELLELERGRARRHGYSLSVLMIDIDHFKRINDRWGHAQGDLVLVAIARALREHLRNADQGSRYGGEEFLAILPDTNKAQAMEVAERIRHGISQLRTVVDGTAIAVTASIGVATLAAGECVDSLVARADAAMYAAKSGGRDRCMDASDSAGTIAGPARPEAVH